MTSHWHFLHWLRFQAQDTIQHFLTPFPHVYACARLCGGVLVYPRSKVPFTNSFNTSYFVYVWMYACACKRTVCGSSLHCVGSGDHTQIIRLGGKLPYDLGHFAGPLSYFRCFPWFAFNLNIALICHVWSAFSFEYSRGAPPEPLNRSLDLCSFLLQLVQHDKGLIFLKCYFDRSCPCSSIASYWLH